MSNSLKDHSLGTNNHIIQTNKAKDLWKSYVEEDNSYLAGFSWPPRSYSCSFCKREFKSAQALGGHMNVHRRDRARLRQSSPPRDDGFGKYPLINLNTYPSSNPNVSSSYSSSPKRVPPMLSSTTTVGSASMVYSPLSCTSSCFADKPFGNSSPKRADLSRMNGAKGLSGYGDFGSCPGNKRLFFKKTENTVRLDLEIGMFKGYDQDLDLELRLGYS